MIDQKGFGSSVGIVGSGRSIYVASLFILNIGLARSLSAEGFGSFQQVYLFNILFVIFSLGIPETVTFFLPRLEGAPRSAFLGQTIMLLLGLAAAVGLVLGLGAPLFARLQGNPSITVSIRLFGIYGAFYVLSSFADPVFIYFRHIRYLFFLSAAHGLFLIAVTGWRMFGGISVETIFSAMMVFGSFKCFAAFALLYHIRDETGPISFFGPRQSIMLQLAFAMPVALSVTIESLSKWLDKIVVSFVLGTEPLGLFSVGAIEIPFVTVFITTVYGLIAPRLNELEHAGEIGAFRDLVRKLLSFIAKLIWPLAVYLFVFADHLIPLVFTESFDQSVTPFRIYLLLMPLRIFSFGVVLIALGRPRIVLFGAAGSLAVNLVLNVVLVKWIGFLGPAIATVVSTVLQMLYLFSHVLRGLGSGPGGVLPLKKLGQVAVSAAIAATVAWLLTRGYQRDGKAVLSSLTIMTGAYIFVASRFGLFRILSFGDLLRGRIIERKDQHQDD